MKLSLHMLPILFALLTTAFGDSIYIQYSLENYLTVNCSSAAKIQPSEDTLVTCELVLNVPNCCQTPCTAYTPSLNNPMPLFTYTGQGINVTCNTLGATPSARCQTESFFLPIYPLISQPQLVAALPSDPGCFQVWIWPGSAPSNAGTIGFIVGMSVLGVAFFVFVFGVVHWKLKKDRNAAAAGSFAKPLLAVDVDQRYV